MVQNVHFAEHIAWWWKAYHALIVFGTREILRQSGELTPCVKTSKTDMIRWEKLPTFERFPFLETSAKEAFRRRWWRGDGFLDRSNPSRLIVVPALAAIRRLSWEFPQKLSLLRLVPRLTKSQAFELYSYLPSCLLYSTTRVSKLDSMSSSAISWWSSIPSRSSDTSGPKE